MASRYTVEIQMTEPRKEMELVLSTFTLGVNARQVADQNRLTGERMIKFWTGTQEEYDSLEPESRTLYFIKERPQV